MMSDQPQDTPRVHDKRGKKKPQVDDAFTVDDEFTRQRQEEEEAQRASAEFDALSEEEKQRLLAEQAAAESGNLPYEGAGLKTEGETSREVLSVFVTVLDLDGTATAMPLEEFEKHHWSVQREITPRMIYRACSEIMLDVQAAETSHLTLQMMQHVGAQAAAAQRAQALHDQLSSRGVRAPRR